MKTPSLLLAFVFAALLATAAAQNTIVDFTLNESMKGKGLEARNPDKSTHATAIWRFSEAKPLFKARGSEGSNVVIFGGLDTAWTASPPVDYTPVQLLIFPAKVGKYYLAIAPEGVKSSSATGALIWKKQHFLNNGGLGQVALGAESSMSASVAGFSGDTDRRVHFIVQEGGAYFVSMSSLSDENTQNGTLTIKDFPAEQWAPLNVSDYSIGAYAVRAFHDIEAVGIFFITTRSHNTKNPTYVEFTDFLVSAQTSRSR